jgi:Na+-translocating ferredoxin:NAD+ oxidoreductase RnfE subunit
MFTATAVPMHLGALHPYETVLLAVLAFGPFVVLAVVVAVLRRRDIARDEQEQP